MSIFIGILAFLLFYLYDLNQIVLKNKIMNYLFFIGCFLLAGASILLVYDHLHLLSMNMYQIITILFAIIFFLLLIYTLFFSLPFEDTYVEDIDKKRNCCKTGMYALCRHPGVLWMFGFYFMLAMCFQTSMMWKACIIFNLMNLLYVIIQDKWTFINQFIDYKQYKKQVPFLLPNKDSVKNCLYTLKRGDKDEA